MAGDQIKEYVCAVGVAQAGKMAVVGSVHALVEEMVAEAEIVVEGRALHEVAGSWEHQAAACTEAEEQLVRELYTQQGWAQGGQV